MANTLPTKVARLVQAASKYRSELGEAPIWDDRASRLLWLDVLGARLFVKDSLNVIVEHNLKSFTEHITTIVPVSEPEFKDIIILGTTEGYAKYDLSTRAFESHPSNPIHPSHPTQQKNIQARCNDGKADPLGRLWLGSLVRNLQTLDVVSDAAGLYVLEGWSGTPTQVLSDVTISNGIAWHNDKMYYTDSPTAHIDVMDFHSTDTLETICASRRQQIKCSEGYPPVPDGCVVDKEGYVWSALFGAGCVRRYNPETGEAVAEIKLPTEAGMQSTACAWGGDDYSELYITSAHEYWDEDQKAAFPLAGCLFVCSSEDIVALCGDSVGCGSHKFRMTAV